MNEVNSVTGDNGSPRTILWFPIGEIRQSTNTFFWIFNILDASDSIFVGLADLEKVKSGWSTSGLYYGGMYCMPHIQMYHFVKENICRKFV